MEGRREDWGGVRVGGGHERRGENDSERDGGRKGMRG